MNSRGQLAIEFLLLVVFALVFLSATIFPAIDEATAATRDIRGLSETRLAAEKLANTINSLQNQASSARQTITLVVPQNASIYCDQTPTEQIRMEFVLHGATVSACQTDADGDNAKCTKLFPINASLLCAGAPYFPIQGPQIANVLVQKNANQIVVSRT